MTKIVLTPTPSMSGRDAIFVTICSGALLEMAQISEIEISPNFDPLSLRIEKS